MLDEFVISIVIFWIVLLFYYEYYFYNKVEYSYLDSSIIIFSIFYQPQIKNSRQS